MRWTRHADCGLVEVFAASRGFPVVLLNQNQDVRTAMLPLLVALCFEHSETAIFVAVQSCFSREPSSSTYSSFTTSLMTVLEHPHLDIQFSSLCNGGARFHDTVPFTAFHIELIHQGISVRYVWPRKGPVQSQGRQRQYRTSPLLTSNMQFTAKQLNRQSAKAGKDETTEKNKLKKVLCLRAPRPLQRLVQPRLAMPKSQSTALTQVRPGHSAGT